MKLGYLGYGTGTHRPFDQVFPSSEKITPETVANVDALIIWGGEDICTAFYNEDGGVWTGADRVPTRRDKVEMDAVQAAIDLGKPIIGVCRGAQLLCAAAGGKLIQHVNGHNRGDHAVLTQDGRTITTTSVHHQMMWPYVDGVEYNLLAWSKSPQATVYNFKAGDERFIIHNPEPEVVWFPKIKGLAIQGHPEFMSPGDEFVSYCMELTREFVVSCVTQ